jgi:hypothetical protein
MTTKELLERLERAEWQTLDTDTLPKEAAFYEQLVQEFFATFDPTWDQEPDLDEAAVKVYFQWHRMMNQVVELLRYHLSYGADTFSALLWIAEWSTRHPDGSIAGTNALAGVVCRLWGERPAGFSYEELVPLFERYCENEELSVNAWQCLRSIAQRRPDLRSKELDMPPLRDRITYGWKPPGK